jgi:hypothetical protein
MGTPFGNPVVGGGGALVVPAIHSPNYVAGSSGWTEKADGSAEFQNVTIRGTITAGSFTGTDFVINGSGAFFYSGTPALGNLIVSIAGVAGTDTYGNAYPQGINVTTGSISGTTISGSTIIGALIESAATGRRTAIDSNGDIKVYNASGAVLFWFKNSLDAQFFYADTGSATQGALTSSIASAAGTDPFGTSYKAGTVNYVVDGVNTYEIITGLLGGSNQPGIAINNRTSTPFLAPSITAFVDTSGSLLGINSGNAVNGGTQSVIDMQDSTLSGLTAGKIFLEASRILFGVNGNAFWDDIAQSLSLPAAGGPFVSGESFHTVSLASGLSGGLSGGAGIRVKKLPWNAIWMDVQLTVSTSGTLTCGSLPDSTYYPNVARNIPLAPSVAGATAYVHIPTSGGIQIITSNGAGNPGGSFMYPTN